MGRFAKLNNDIGNLAKEILKNKDLCKLLYYEGYEPLKQPNINGFSKLYNQRLLVFTPKVFEITDTGSYLMIRPARVRPSRGGYYVITNLFFDILIHHQARQIKGGDRALFIADIIEDMMIDKAIGIGRANFYSIEEITNRDATFSGLRLIYTDADFRK